MLQGSETDEDLMRFYQEGSSAALAALYERHSGKIFGYLKTRTGKTEEASDLLQEVFLKIHKSKPLYNPKLPALPWIFSITHSVLIDSKRKQQKSREVLGFEFDQVPAPASPEPYRGQIMPLLKKLPPSEQVALQMRHLDEKTFEEIAEHLKTSSTNVRQIVSRGIKHLKKLTARKGETL